MAKVLYVEASPRKARSASIEVARVLLDALAAKGHEIDTLDLWAAPLREFDGALLEAKYAVMSSQNPTPDQQAAWDGVAAMVEQLKSAQLLVVATPMWNFSIPYKLKHWIDLVTQPGLSFGVDPAKGYYGLITGTRAVGIYARGGDYSGEAAAYDQQTRYLASVLAFMGITDHTAVTIDSGLSGPDADRAAREAAKAQVLDLAAAF